MSSDYVVRSGDTLGAIAQRHQTTLSSLLRLNPDIENPDKIFPGQSLKLPAANDANFSSCEVGQVTQEPACSGEIADVVHVTGSDELILLTEEEPSGVTVSGPLVRMNSGGGPGSGSAAAAEAPVLPTSFVEGCNNSDHVELAEVDTRATVGPVASSVPSLRAAAKKDVALVKQCGRQSDGSCAMAECACEESPA